MEPICRKYLELRYRLLPYLYSVVRESTVNGLPVMRSLWLHYPDDPVASARGDEYLWGRDILAAPVVEQAATSRKVYLPRGDWYDFWTGERHAGGREITRAVDLETMPLFVRAGTILPLGPVKQFSGERADEPLSITVYPGSDGEFLLYEDDGGSFNYRKGEWMGLAMTWKNAQRVLRLDLQKGSRMLPPLRREIAVKYRDVTRTVVFDGHPGGGQILMLRFLPVLLLTVLCGAQTPSARIKIDIDRSIGEVDPLVFGNFAEQLGRMIYGGIYDEGSPLSDKDGYRTDVMDVVKKMGVSILRYPGGSFSSGYNWTDGIGAKDQRPVRAAFTLV